MFSAEFRLFAELFESPHFLLRFRSLKTILMTGSILTIFAAGCLCLRHRRSSLKAGGPLSYLAQTAHQ
jgi:hypothetical protein